MSSELQHEGATVVVEHHAADLDRVVLAANECVAARADGERLAIAPQGRARAEASASAQSDLEKFTEPLVRMSAYR